jgi:hypothetical protein
MFNDKKFYVVAVDMGYGHQRAAFPFADLARGGIIDANNYPGMEQSEKKLWKNQSGFYDFMSYFKKIPLLGPAAFGIMDKFQDIDEFYPKRPLKQTTAQQQFFFNKVKQGVGRALIKQLNREPLPLLATFFVPVYFSEYYGYKGQVYCLICDADISRSWAPINPARSSVIYLASTERARQRLMMYGVKDANIVVTGFPLPKTNIGGEDKSILKADLSQRLARLDPSGIFRKTFGSFVASDIGLLTHTKPTAPVTLTFAVGGAGAQREAAADFLPSLKPLLKDNRLKLNLVAGSRPEVKEYFSELLAASGLRHHKNVQIIYHRHKPDYFKIFNRALRTTDILMTKPSELSFYAGLGLPILMMPIVGAQERENRSWLMSIGAGLDAEDLRYMGEWLVDWLNDGRLARGAWQGYLEAENLATYKIEKIICRHG